MNFSEYFSLYTEARFRDSKYLNHIMDIPMFSLFVKKAEPDVEQIVDMQDDYIAGLFKEARKRIGKLGFPSMHANVIITDVDTKARGAAGLAYRKRKFMAMDVHSLTSDQDEFAVNIIVHEWGHLYMYNNSKAFKKAIKDLYSKLIKDAHTAATSKEDPLSDFDQDYTQNRKYIDPKNRKLPTIAKNSVFKDVEDRGMKIVNAFSSVIGGFKENIIGYYILAQMPIIKKEYFRYLPHLLPVNTTLDEPTWMTNYLSHQNKVIDKGTEIQLQKISGNDYGVGWIQQLYIGNARYETQSRDAIPFNINETEQSLEKKATEAFHKHLKMYKINTSPEELLAEMQKQVSHMSIPGFSKETQVAIKNTLSVYMKDYVFPQFQKMVQDGEWTDLLDKPYNALWLFNDLKPKNLPPVMSLGDKESIRKTLDTKLDPNRNDMADDKDEYLREYVKHLTQWHDDYGIKNNDEYWATAVEGFFKLPFKYKRDIVKAISENR